MTSPDPLDLAPNRRHAEITISGRRWRVREPPPRAALDVIVATTPMLGEWITKILSGAMLRIKPALCPRCGGTSAQNIGSGRWLCTTEPTGEASPCRTVWPQERETDDQGRPVAVTVSWALERPEFRARFALEVREAMERVDNQRRVVGVEPGARIQVGKQTRVVVSGLSEGAQVLAPAAGALREGVKVKPAAAVAR